MGYEEVDYSEEAKHDLFESVRRERLDWVRCLISRMPPPYDQVKEAMERLDLSISREDYKRVCRDMGL